VGQAVARRLRSFGARVLAYDPFVKAEDAGRVGAELVSLDRLLEESDFVSLHAAVTDQSRGLIGAAELARMKPGAFLINTARAALVDEEALVEALRSGHLGGAALDVFSVEPPGSDHPLLASPNVIATPHIGGNTFEVAAHQGQVVVEELGRLLRGQRPRHILNPETLPGFRWEGPRQPVAPEALEKLGERPGPAVSDLQQAARPTPEPTKAAPPPPSQPRAETLVGAGLAGLRRIRERLGRKPQPAPSEEEPPAGPQMERVLRAFIARAVADPALAEFARAQQVTTHYVLTDVGLEFYLSFQDGQVTGDLGPPPEPAQVRLKMKVDVLDGMFTGRINAPRAAMTGKLSFSGDTRLAMGLQRIQKDLTRLYQEAREEAGGPGDLTAVEEAPRAIAKPAVPAGEDLRQEIVQVVGELYQIGLITATGGNVSARVPDTDRVWITPSQLFKGGLRPEHLVPINLDGEMLDPDALAPSSERLMHCAVYRARLDVGAVIHAHAPQATILGLTGLPFAPISTEAALLGDLPRVPFIMPGTRELAEAVVEALGDGPAVLLQNHGLLVAAGTLRRAADLVEIIERTAELILGCYAVGEEPPTLPDDVVTMLREMGELLG
jgi:autoinducer 2 (AI-2) kinase